MTHDKIELLERLSAWIERAQRVEFLVPQDTGLFSIDDVSLREVRLAVDATLELLRDVSRIYDSETSEDPADDPSPAEDEFLLEIGAAIAAEFAAREVASMAFVGRTQLLESYEALLTALTSKQMWVTAAHVDTSLRRTVKALITLETSIREYENLEPIIRQWGDLSCSLDIRRMYARFRRWIVEQQQPSADKVPDLLHQAVQQIDALRQHELYPLFRISDRVPLRQLQKRIRHWLDAPPPGAAEEQDLQGVRLWHDLESFAELLTQVNNREELREHDRRAADRLWNLLFETEEQPQELDAAHLEELTNLAGCDDTLDQLAQCQPLCEVHQLRQPLEHLRQQLTASFKSKSSYTPFH